MNIVKGCRMRPEGPKIETEGRERCGVLGKEAASPSPPAKGSGGALWAPPAGFGAKLQPLKGFPLFSALKMTFPDTMILLTVDNKNEKFLSHSFLSQLVCIWWCCMMFLCLRPHRAEALSDAFVWRLSDVWRLSVWRLSRTSGLTREQRGLWRLKLALR